MATTYDKASLVMIPSGVKESKLYSIKPTSGDGDFTFSRGTDTATRVNASGLIEKERSNQILQSNTFTTTWSTTRASFVSGQAGYDGTNDAWAFVDDTNNSTHLSAQSLSLGASVATFSIYAKAGDVDFLAVRFEGSAVDYAYFNLASGTLGTIDSDYIEARITDVGGGWYRCEATRVLAASGNQVVLLAAQANNDPTYAGAGTTAIYIQDAMVNEGLVAQPYIETTTAAVYEGITDNLPRLDYHNPDSPTPNSCPSLKLEPSRTNVITNSEYFTSSANVSLSYNNARSPEGVQNATYITGDAGTLTKFVDFNSAANGAYTISVFAKYDSHQWIQLAMGGVATYANFDIQNGVVGGTNGTSDIEDYGNGWYRCSVKTTTGTPLSHFLLMVDNGSAARLASSSSTNSFWAYGMQSEIGSYPTSYIPTYGASASRSEDTCTDGGDADIYNDSEGTLFAEIFIEEEIDENVNISISNGVHAQNLFKFIYLPTNNELRFEVYGSSLDTRIQKFNLPLGVYHKIAGSYDGTNTKLYIDGVEVDTTSTNQLPTGLSEFNFDRADGTAPFTGNVKQVLYFPTALTNAELAALTTI